MTQVKVTSQSSSILKFPAQNDLWNPGLDRLVVKAFITAWKGFIADFARKIEERVQKRNHSRLRTIWPQIFFYGYFERWMQKCCLRLNLKWCELKIYSPVHINESKVLHKYEVPYYLYSFHYTVGSGDQGCPQWEMGRRKVILINQDFYDPDSIWGYD